MDSKNALLGVLGGIAAGALLGVLFAPEKGSDTRKNISSKGEDIAEDLKEKFNEILESLSEKYKQVKEEVIDFAEKGKTVSKEA
jgi:gas vesicle protein